MTNNLFPLPYWAPALQRVPIPLQLLNAAYQSGERPCRGVPLHACDKALIEQRAGVLSAAGKFVRRFRPSISARGCA
jgi:hypothetical protein